MPHKNLSLSRSIRIQTAVYVLVILATLAGLSPAFTRLSALAQGDGAPADPGDAPQMRAVLPAATPTPFPTFVRKITLLASDLIYSPQTRQLYASVWGGNNVSRSNTVTWLNPETGEIGPSLFVGSEPTRLALADDGQTLYVALRGAGAVRKVDVSAQTAGIQFHLGNASPDGPVLPEDIAVMPGSPGTVAVSKLNSGVTIYDEGVPRAQSGDTGGPVLFASPTRLYTGNNPVQKMEVGANGLTNVGAFGTSSFGQTQFVNGLVYLSSGIVYDVEAGVVKGRFSGVDDNSVMAIDAAKNRAFFLTKTNSSNMTLLAYELDTFRPTGSVMLQGLADIYGIPPTSLVRWGKNGLAVNSYSHVFLIQSALVDDSDPIPSPTPTPPATPTPTPPSFQTTITRVNLPANDLVINAATQTLYASVPSSAGGTVGNTITSVDPKTASIGTSTFIGSEPGKLALSDDGQVLYVNLEGDKAVRSFDLATKTPGLQFPVGVNRVADMEVVPGQPGSVVISRGESFSVYGGVAVYDNGVQRPLVSNNDAGRIGPIEFGATASTLYGYSGYLRSELQFVKYQVDSMGIRAVSVTDDLLSGYHLSGYRQGMKFVGGRLYVTNGHVIDPEAKILLGSLGHNYGHAPPFVVDQTLGRVFVLISGYLYAYDINTFRMLGRTPLPNVGGGIPNGLVRWGTNGIALYTNSRSDFEYIPPGVGQIYLVQSTLISDAEPIPSQLEFSEATYTGGEYIGRSNVSVAVTRKGGLAGTVTVNYATGGGNANPGSDYTETSGTLSFADGEITKYFTVTIKDDALYEGAEPEFIRVTLSGQSPGALLGVRSTASVNILDNEPRPTLVPLPQVVVPEGQSGTTHAQFIVRLSAISVDTIAMRYMTLDHTAKVDSDYVAASGTLIFRPGELEKTVSLQIKGDTVDEGDEQFLLELSGPSNITLTNTIFTITIVDDERPSIQFGAAQFTASEGDGRATIVVTRFGLTTEPATVNYGTIDDPRAVRCDDNDLNGGAAFARCDYATTFDTLVFAPGESQKTFPVALVDDGHVEPKEFVNLLLVTPAGVPLGAQSSTMLSITDNDAPNQSNPVDAHDFFVRQHYLDFLSREPEADGLAAWTGVLARCADPFNTDANSPSALCDRNVVSSSFFRSTEFELKAYFVYRFYRVAFNRRPEYGEFISDMQRVTGQTADEVYLRRRRFADTLVLRQEFTLTYGVKTNAEFVDSLLARYRMTAIDTPDPANPDGDTLVRLTRDELVAALDAQPQGMTRAQVLRAVVQSREVGGAEYNGAFVAMQYYGYLRRAPEQAGYDAWLQVITRGDGYRVMVNGFMNSTEYRLRFGK